jgi:WD40 repeat protein
VAFSPDGRFLGWGNEGEVLVHDRTANQAPRRLRGHQQDVQAVAFSPDGRFLASAGLDQTIMIWDNGQTVRAQTAGMRKCPEHQT